MIWKKRNKKGSWGIAVGIFFSILFFGVIITVLVIINQKSDGSPNDEQIYGNMTLYLKAKDNLTSKQLNSKYQTYYIFENNTNVNLLSGELIENSFTEIKNIPADKTIYIVAWDNNHYLNILKKEFTTTEILNKRAKQEIELHPIGSLTISHEGTLDQKESDIKIKIKAEDGYWERTGVKLSWTAGIINAYVKENVIRCDEAYWINDESLPTDYYRCGLDYIEKCEDVFQFFCYLPEEKVPIRFAELTDSVIYLGKSLEPNEEYEFELTVKTLNSISSSDEIQLVFYDKEREYDENLNVYVWKSEKQEDDIAGKDYTYTIKYE